VNRELLVPLLCLLLPGTAGAHALRLSTGEVTVEGRRVQAVVQFARADLETLRPEDVAGTVKELINAGKVRLRVRGDENGARRTIALDGAQFIGRLLQHVLPPGFKRIRHYGLLAPATKADRLRRARQLLAMPAANPQACEDAQAFMRRVAAIDVDCCPHCSIGRWRVLQHVAADRPALNSITTPTACRGPP